MNNMIISKILFISSIIMSVTLLIIEIKKRGLSEEKNLYRYTSFLVLLMFSVYMFICFANFSINEIENVHTENNW
ncbi:MAG: hypothetical protein COX48_00035, partial [bacterium (Candidatus Stahlbacteria) CG23_combo_of_CG06-09_8_20_14_all_34_7]